MSDLSEKICENVLQRNYLCKILIDRRHFRIIIYPLIVATAILLLFGCGKSSEEETKQPDQNNNTTPIVNKDNDNTKSNSEQIKPSNDKPPVAPITPKQEKPTQPLSPDDSCITPECHVQFRNAKFLHGPAAVNDCWSCHVYVATGHTYPLKRKGNDTCIDCHEEYNTKVHQHAAMELPGCLGCHNPHYSNSRYFLNQDTVEAVCTECHPKVDVGQTHEPYDKGQCTACHDPHESDFKKLLKGGDGVDHCYVCHEDLKEAVNSLPYKHAALENGCEDCHVSHSGLYKGNLKMPLEKLCYSCHQDIEKYVSEATTGHSAVFTGDRCINCHDPHVSGQPKLLKEIQSDLCLQCHNAPVMANNGEMIPDMTPAVKDKPFLHGPVKSDQCAACHNAHGSSNAKLLRAAFPESFYTSFDLSSYELCFTCHEKDLVMLKNTNTLTNFRNGDLNLHYSHVHRDEKGRTCKTCHEVHGSDAPRHMAEKVPFENSTWLMDIKFVQTQNGGSCAPDCHKSVEYDRINAKPIPQDLKSN